MLRQVVLAASRNDAVRTVVARAPVSRSVVRRFVAGEGVDDAVRTAADLQSAGLAVSLDHLGEDVRDEAQAAATVQAYCRLLGRLGEAGLAVGGRAEVSVKLTAVGLSLDPGLAAGNARRICAAAERVGTTVTLDMEDSGTTDATLSVLAAVRGSYPATGAVLQAYLHRTESDCRDLATAGSRVRLCKGAYDEPASVAFRDPAQVSASYERCLEILMTGPGYPMVATHDPALVRRASALAATRDPGTYEFQMLYGVRPEEQRRLAATGSTVRIYTPYGDQWYGYLMRRLAERPANVAFFLRALASRS